MEQLEESSRRKIKETGSEDQQALGINITATGEDPPTNAPIKLEESGPEGHHDTRDLRRGVITNVSFWELESA